MRSQADLLGSTNSRKGNIMARRLWFAFAALGLLAGVLPAGDAAAQPPIPPAAVAAPPHTLWRFLGIPQGYKRLYDARANRLGNHPGLEAKPPLKAIGDPMNLLEPNLAIKKAAEIKIQEDLAPQKIKALKYLAKIGCGCYPGVKEALMAALDDCTERVRYEAAKAIAEAAVAHCEVCSKNCCCDPAMLEKLRKIACEQDANCCWIEPSERVREMAREACEACRRAWQPPVIVEPAPTPVPPPPETRPPEIGPPETRPPEVRPPETRPPEPEARLQKPSAPRAAHVNDDQSAAYWAQPSDQLPVQPAQERVTIGFGEVPATAEAVQNQPLAAGDSPGRVEVTDRQDASNATTLVIGDQTGTVAQHATSASSPATASASDYRSLVIRLRADSTEHSEADLRVRPSGAAVATDLRLVSSDATESARRPQTQNVNEATINSRTAPQPAVRAVARATRHGGQASRETHLATTVEGWVVAVNPGKETVTLRFRPEQSPEVGAQVKIFHEYLLGKQCLGTLEVVNVDERSAVARPVEPINFSKIAVNDRATFQVIETVLDESQVRTASAVVSDTTVR